VNFLPAFQVGANSADYPSAATTQKLQMSFLPTLQMPVKVIQMLPAVSVLRGKTKASSLITGNLYTVAGVRN
jgi:hypothetical protein